jgi:hypothetical protein
MPRRAAIRDALNSAHDFYGNETVFKFWPSPERHDIRQILPS